MELSVRGYGFWYVFYSFLFCMYERSESRSGQTDNNDTGVRRDAL